MSSSLYRQAYEIWTCSMRCRLTQW